VATDLALDQPRAILRNAPDAVGMRRFSRLRTWGEIVTRHPMTARSLVLLLVIVSCAGAAVVRGYGAGASGTPVAHAANPIQKENLRSGSRSWSLDQTARSRRIEGFASEVSALPGQKVHFHVSTVPAARYRIVLYRLGWYRGAGARIVACIPGCHRDRRGKARRRPRPAPRSGLVRARWPVTDTFRFPHRAVSGYFLAKLELTSGPAHGKVTYIPLILRAPPSRHSTILVQASVNTWQAFNAWGGKSLYPNNSTRKVPANHVSFERPYDANRPVPIQWEIGILRFLEREGYDVSYVTDVDTDRNPAELRRHRLVISAGNDEYWSKRMRDAFEAARDGGTNLAFLGADIADWQIRYENNRRTIVEYRDAREDPVANPALKTVRFGSLIPPRPQCELLGTSYTASRGPNDPPRSYVVNPPAFPDVWFRGTGFTMGSELPDSVGPAWDTIQPGCAVPPLTVFFSYQGSDSTGKPTSAEVVRYVAPSGARVFSWGSLYVAWGLDNYYGHPNVLPDARLQQFVRNALVDLTSRH
jgi:N,N-dimethylformamidase beta subunit-like, C-terminal